MTMLNQEMFRFVTLPEVEATQLAESQGFVVRVVARDGEQLIITADVNSERINFSINQGVVEQAYVG